MKLLFLKKKPNNHQKLFEWTMRLKLAINMNYDVKEVISGTNIMYVVVEEVYVCVAVVERGKFTL